MKRLIAFAAMAVLSVPAGALFAQTGEPAVQLFATAEEAAPAAAGSHTVARGETLWSLSGKYYGDPFQWGRLYNANLDKVSDPDHIYPNQDISVPELTGTDGSPTLPDSGATADFSGSEKEILSGSETGEVPGQAVTVSMNLSGAGVPASRHNVSLLSDEMPEDQQEWTGNTPKIVPGNWKGDGVIAAKFSEGSDTMADGLTENGDRVRIKTVKPAAFRPGDMLVSYIKGAPAYDINTGEELGIKLQKTGILKVLGVSGNEVTARVVNSGTSVDKGQLVAR